MQKKIRLFDGFTGYGGASWGFKKAGIPVEIVGFSEIDKVASNFYLKHFPGVRNYGDITKIPVHEIPPHDILCGGFPCQPFSQAGKRLGFTEYRGNLFNNIMELLIALGYDEQIFD
jgi:DNA (cytosine-5)-methyltransferase 1